MMSPEKSVAARVKDGLAFLTQRGPEDWRERLNVATLVTVGFGAVLGEDQRCVCDRVFGTYGMVHREVVEIGGPWNLGFNSYTGDDNRAVVAEWKRQVAGK